MGLRLGGVIFNLPDGDYTYEVTASTPSSGPTALNVTLEDEFSFSVNRVYVGDSVVIIGTYDDTNFNDTFTFT